jgi:arylesterase/paraoxonase
LIKLLVRTGLIFGITLALLAVATASFLIRGGAFRAVETVSLRACEAIEIPLGSAEDIQIDHEGGVALLSVLDRRRSIEEGKSVKGTILSISLATAASTPVPALSSQPKDFRPHGLSLFTDQNGLKTLVVINHAVTGELIEVFRKGQSDELFKHVHTLTSPLLVAPNDLVAVDSEKFYVANDSGAENGIEKVAEMIFAVGLSPLVYFNGRQFDTVADDLKSSGGINVSQDGTELYVGQTAGESIRIYSLNTDKSIGDLKDTIKVGSGVDNIDIATDGALWIANHTNTLALVKHFGNAASLAPTQIQKLTYHSTGKEYRLETVFENDGSLISAGSVGTRYKDAILIGSITERKLLKCSVNN